MKKLILIYIIIVINIFPSYKLVSLYWPPYVEGENSGIVVEVVRDVFELMGEEVEILIYPWSRALEKGREPGVLGVFPAYKNLERRVNYYFSDIIGVSKISFFFRRDNNINYDNIFDLEKHRIGVVRDYDNPDIIELNPQLELDISNTDLQSFLKLKFDRLDLVVSDTYVAWDILGDKEFEMMNFEEYIPPLEVKELYLLINKNHSEASLLLSRFNLALKEYKESGRYEKVIKSYLE